MNKIFETLENNHITFGNGKIGVVIDDDNDPWFNAKDVTTLLEYKYPKDAIQNNVDIDAKIKLQDIKTDVEHKIHPHSIYIKESGLYSLILRSNMPKAKIFYKWVTNEVLPSIRKYGYYKLKKQNENEINDLLKQIDFLEKQNQLMKNDLVKIKFPEGGLVYALDYTDNGEKSYRIGMTDNMKHRKSIHNTHTFHRKPVVTYIETDVPKQMEKCVQAMLLKFRYRDNTDIYVCEEKHILKAFKKCKKHINDMNQTGGGNFIENEIVKIQLKIERRNKKLIKYDNLLL